MPGYWLGIDLGTTSTAAAICRPAAGGLEVQVVPLSSQSYAIPSVLFLPGDGSLLVGEEAQRRSLTDPYRVVREFKSRMGDEIPLLVGGAPFYAHDLAAEFVSSLCQHVTRQEGEPPQAVALTCPASWGPDKTALFGRAVQHTGVPNVTTLTEPQAAAIGYAGRASLPPGATVAVYDLGAARFDVAVLRQDAQDTFAPLGRSEGIAGLGGLSFDEVIFEYVCAAAGVPLEEMDLADHGLAAEVAQLRRECAEAKETLSASYDAIISVTLGGAQHWVRLTRAELEEMIRPDLDRTIEAMHRAFGSADVVAGELDAILLTGGSARIPLVSQLIAAEFGRAPIVDADPKVVVAAGAARFAAPAGSPVRDLGSLPADAAGERRSGPIALLRHPSRKALLGAAALAVLVVGGAVTALRTPVLSDLTSHHGNGGGTVASGGAPSTSGSGSPTPSAQSSAKPTGKASGTKSAATSNGPVAAGPSSVAAAAAQSSNPVTNPSKTTKAGPTKAPVKTKAPTAAPTSAKPAPSPTTSTPTPSPSTSSPVPSPSSSSTTSTPPAASADPSSATPSTSATATT